MSGIRYMAYSINNESRDQGAVRIRADDRFIYDLLRGDNDSLRGKSSLFLFANNTPNVGITFCISALNMHNGYIRIEGRHNDNLPPRVRVDHSLVLWVDTLQITRCGLIHRHERYPCCASLEPRDHTEMGIFLPLQVPGFDLAAYKSQRAYARIAHVGEDHFTRTASCNHLIID